jgi:PadR family transcriptional regulator PadR
VRKVRQLSDKAKAVLEQFVEEPEREWFGLELLREIGVPSGSLYPILHRLEERGFLEARWEPIEEAAPEGRRPRRLYRLNPDSMEQARESLLESNSSPRSAFEFEPRPLPT